MNEEEIKAGLKFLEHLGLVKWKGDTINAEQLIEEAFRSIPLFIQSFASKSGELAKLGEDGVLDVFLSGIIFAKYMVVEGDRAISKDDFVAMLMTAHACMDLTPTGRAIKAVLYEIMQNISGGKSHEGEKKSD